MTQHTPGPWDYNGPPHNMHIVQAAEPQMRVCFLTSDGPTVANARLIAAAPDLLSGAREVVRLALVHTASDEQWNDAIDALGAAIIKATGADEA